jgi:hypothetical protein
MDLNFEGTYLQGLQTKGRSDQDIRVAYHRLFKLIFHIEDFGISNQKPASG